MIKAANDMNLQKGILKYVHSHNDASFVEIEEYFEATGLDYKGDCGIELSNDELSNVILWYGWKAEYTDLIGSMLKANELHARCTNSFVYAIDGKTLKLPVAKQPQHYKKRHWLPVLVY